MKKHRVFIGFFEVAGIFTGLKKGLLELRHKASLCELLQHPFDYEKNSDFNSWLGRQLKSWLRSSLGLDSNASNHLIPRFFRRIIGEVYCLILAARYDVFIFSGGISFADAFDTNRKPFFFRLFRRRWIFLFTGSDSRAPYCSRYGYENRGELMLLRDLETMVAAKSSCVKRAETSGDVLIDFPSNAHFHHKPFVSFLHMGLPVSQARQRPEPPEGTPIRILHAPSNEKIKGSEPIRMALGQLRKEGFDFEYAEVKNTSNQRVLELLQKTDLVIDQIYSDSPMAGLASEAAAAGVVPIVGGYFWGLLEDLEGYSSPPVIQCHPLDLYHTLKTALQTSQKNLYRTGQEARSFVRDHFGQNQYASRILDCINGKISEECYIQPGTMSYGLGCGMDLLETAECVSALCEIAGVKSLSLPKEQDKIRCSYENMGALDEVLSEEFAKLQKMIPAEIFGKLSELLAENIKISVLLYNRGLSENTSEWQFVRDELNDLKEIIRQRDNQIIKLEKKLKTHKTPKKISSDKVGNAPAKFSGHERNIETVAGLLGMDQAFGNLPPTVTVVMNRLEKRNGILSQLAKGERASYRGEKILVMKRKLENFRGMIERRDEKILKLEAKLAEKRK